MLKPDQVILSPCGHTTPTATRQIVKTTWNSKATTLASLVLILTICTKFQQMNRNFIKDKRITIRKAILPVCWNLSHNRFTVDRLQLKWGATANCERPACNMPTARPRSCRLSLAITNNSKQKKLVGVYEPIVHKHIDAVFEKLYTYTACFSPKTLFDTCVWFGNDA